MSTNSFAATMKTDVCLTFDVEFTIGGAFSDPANKQPVSERSVFCDVDGESQGLGFILNTLSKHKLTATFFVEALNFHYFGDSPMSDIAKTILAAGHDVQLHLHPCWRHFRMKDWQTQLSSIPPNDSMAERSTEDIREIIQEGIQAFARWGIAKPIAIRTGGLQVDKTVYHVMQELGVPLASNIGVAISSPINSELHFSSGRHSIAGVLEMPVLSYCDLSFRQKKHLKSLTITGSSWSETRHLLNNAVRRNISPVVILSHPSEFVKHRDVQYTQLAPNRLNQSRFKTLCLFLEKNQQHFNVLTFTKGHSCWQAQQEEQALLSVTTGMTIRRMLENKFNDTF